MIGEHPVAIGGIGGSGTRVVANFVKILGYYIGDDLNGANDNLWFTLLFKRRSAFFEDSESFRELASLFLSRMKGNAPPFPAEKQAQVLELASSGRPQHPQEWLRERAASFIGGVCSKTGQQPWGWKEPNTHILIDRFLEIETKLRYIHVVRNPLDMAFNSNQNQLANWGSLFIDGEIALEPRYSLSYWCATHRRMRTLQHRNPGRIMFLDFDDLCENPDTQCSSVAEFLGVELSEIRLARFRSTLRKPLCASRLGKAALAQFDAKDLAYLAEIGH